MALWPSLPNGGGRTGWGVESRRVPVLCAVLIWCGLVTNHVRALFFVDPHAFHRHFHLVNRVDLETVLQAAVFVNDEDGQVRVAHKILGYDPIQKSFAALKHMIRANDPRLRKSL